MLMSDSKNHASRWTVYLSLGRVRVTLDRDGESTQIVALLGWEPREEPFTIFDLLDQLDQFRR